MPIHTAAPRAATKRNSQAQLAARRRRANQEHTRAGRGAASKSKVPFDADGRETNHVVKYGGVPSGPSGDGGRDTTGLEPRRILFTNAATPSVTTRVIINRLRRLAAGATQKRTYS